MKKFNYIKWVTENKHGLLNEQLSGYNNVPFVTCFACIGGQIHTTQSDASGLINSTATPNTGSAQGHCGWTNGYNQDWYTTQGALTAVSGSCGTGSNTGSYTGCAAPTNLSTTNITPLQSFTIGTRTTSQTIDLHGRSMAVTDRSGTIHPIAFNLA